jgi:hypothetical protein
VKYGLTTLIIRLYFAGDLWRKKGDGRMLKRVMLSMLLVALTACVGAAQSRKLNPVDEAPKDPSFKAFRDRLLAAVRQQDETVLYESLDPKITNSFGGEGGVTEFNTLWKMGEERTKLWDELATILSMGGSFSGPGIVPKTFCAPYVYSAFPDVQLDATNYAVITGTGVRVRTQPSLNAPIITSLSYDIVELDHEPAASGEANSEWVRIVAPNGKKGYVFGKYIRSPMDYRACFEKKQGKWKMIALVAGD